LIRGALKIDLKPADAMKYYDEEKMVDIQKAFDAEVLTWKRVTPEPMTYFQIRETTR